MSMVKFSCNIGTSNAEIPLGIQVWIDDLCVHEHSHVCETYHISHEINDDDADHVLRFVLKNKLPEHTVVDESGNILSDARLCIDNIQFDEIECGQIVCGSAEYQHNFNGTGVDTQERFYGEMGCNGTVSLKFTTPIYLWLLEKM
jgi:hypothetical protein